MRVAIILLAICAGSQAWAGLMLQPLDVPVKKPVLMMAEQAELPEVRCEAAEMAPLAITIEVDVDWALIPSTDPTQGGPTARLAIGDGPSKPSLPPAGLLKIPICSLLNQICQMKRNFKRETDETIDDGDTGHRVGGQRQPSGTDRRIRSSR